MPNTQKEENNEIEINEAESSLASFTKRPVPSGKQVEQFEEMVASEADNGFEDDFDDQGDEADEEIQESLNEIYQDEDGHMVDVRKMESLKRHGIIYWTLMFLFLFGGLGGLGYVVYNYFYLASGSDASAVELSIESEGEVAAGEEYFYNISYKNNSNVAISGARLSISYPDNFIFLDSDPESRGEHNNNWLIEEIRPQSLNQVKIKGMLIAPEDTNAIALAELRYTPQNFSSEFKKEASFTTIVKQSGLSIDTDYIPTALVGESSEVVVNFEPQEKSYIDRFRITLVPQENAEVTVKPEGEEPDETRLDYSQNLPGVWQVNDVRPGDNRLPLLVKFTDKNADKEKEEVVLRLAKSAADNEYYDFGEVVLEFDVLKTDLNLTMIVNGSRTDQGVDFGETLNYSIVYNNKGETDLRDVVIMAVLDSDFLDWTTLDDPNRGREKGNTLSWTKNEIPDLENLAKHAEGSIDFSIQVMDIGSVEPGLDYRVESYAQFSMAAGGEDEGQEINEDNKSNTIVNRINSDFRLQEEVRYFNDDNMTVGNGPLPLKVGEETSFKVYWIITNNLHELSEALVEVSLPEYVDWDNKNRTNVGAINYDELNHKVVWDIGRLPTSVFRADAEFNIKVTPGEDDANKIMVLKPGSRVAAKDEVTGAEIEKITDPKTTALEDDPIAQRTNDGVVRN